MNLNFNTYILKGFDKEQTDFLSKSLSFISKRLKIENKVQQIEKLNISLTPNDFILLYIDELSLSQLNDPINSSFFDKKEFRNNQIILILDDVNIKQLPAQFQYFPVYPIIFKIDESLIEGEELIENEKGTIHLIEVLYDIVHYIKRSTKPIDNNKAQIFIGPFDDNTTYEFHKITRELVHRDCNLTPAVSNPSAQELINNPDYFKEVLKSIELAIHFVGYESLTEYPEKISPSLQINKIVADFCKTPEGEHLHRIIYIPAEVDETPEVIKHKISQFKSDLDSLQNAEIIQTPVEKFKDVVVSKLSELSIPMEGRLLDTETTDDVYFIYPPGAEEDIKVYTNWFENNHIKYSKSQVDLDQLELLNYHQKKLTQCKGVIIYNNGNIEWLLRKLSDLKKSPGWGRKKPFAFKFICSENNDNKLLNDHIDSSVKFIDHKKESGLATIKEVINQ